MNQPDPDNFSYRQGEILLDVTHAVRGRTEISAADLRDAASRIVAAALTGSGWRLDVLLELDGENPQRMRATFFAVASDQQKIYVLGGRQIRWIAEATQRGRDNIAAAYSAR